MRIGLFLGDLLGRSVEDVVDGVRTAAEEGFESAWLPQVFGWDTLTLLALAGTQVPGIELGTAVVPTYPRHPMVLAGQAVTVQQATGGRLALGIGLSHQVVVEGMWGYSFERPAKHMAEYLSVLLPLLAGEAVDVHGEQVTAVGRLGASADTPPPVLLAALAPVMLRLAGAVADGTITWMVGPRTLSGHILPALTAAADKAGRPAPRVAVGLPVCVSDDADAARARAARTFANYNDLPSYRDMLDHEGAEGPADVAIVGNEDAVAAQVLDLAARGTTDLVASAFGTPDDKARTRALLRRVAEES